MPQDQLRSEGGKGRRITEGRRKVPKMCQ